MLYTHLTLVFLSLIAGSLAHDVPSNIRSFYDKIRASDTPCNNKLATGFYSKSPSEGGTNGFSYCGDALASSRIIYICGTGNALANMDVDCDGQQGGSGDDGRCGKSDDTQSITAFQSEVQGYGKGIRDLNAKVHPYVVFGNEGKKEGYVNFDPKKHGVEHLSVMAVVCGDNMIYGLWGDMNGDDGPPMVGEASISLASACYGKDNIDGDKGHDQADVLYIAFQGKEAVPGKDGAKWNAQNFDEFEKSIQGLGDQLAARVGGGNTSTVSAGVGEFVARERAAVWYVGASVVPMGAVVVNWVMRAARDGGVLLWIL